jgi:hypothetical protein
LEEGMSLYAITSEMQAILDAMLDGGADSPEAMEALDAALTDLDGALEQKAESYAGLIRELEMRSQMRTEEMKRIRALADADATLAERLKERLRDAMTATGKTRIETARFKLSVVGNGGRLPLSIADPDALPEAFTRTIREPDTNAIRAALDGGVPVPGCTLLPRGSRLSIK